MKHLEELLCTPGGKSQEVFQQFLDVLYAEARLMKALHDVPSVNILASVQVSLCLNNCQIVSLLQLCKVLKRMGVVQNWDPEQKMAYAYVENEWYGYNNPKSIHEKVGI